MSEPIFVVGMPRSGTKLLRGLLNGHPDVGIPLAETEFLPAWVEGWRGDLVGEAEFLAFAEGVRGSGFCAYLQEEQGWELDVAAWRAACPGFDVAGVFEGLCRVAAGNPLRWGDKSPGYVHQLGLIWRLWPQARVIHIVRDVRDQVLSLQAAWGKHPVRAAQRWVDGISAARGAGLGDRYLEVRYEDLLADPELTLKRCAAHVGVDFHGDMLHLAVPTENLGDAKGATAVVAGNVEKWRTGMPADLQACVESVAGPTLRALGYPTVHGDRPAKRAAAWRLAKWQVQDGLNLVRAEAGARGWWSALRFRWKLWRG
jgi:hypothetical protein